MQHGAAGLAGSRTASLTLVRIMRITGITTVNTEIPKAGMSSTVFPSSCAAIGFTGDSTMRGAIHDAKIGPAREAVGIPTIRP